MVTVQQTPSPAFLSLCWEVFFASRGRGISLGKHFPWLHTPATAYFVSLGAGTATHAGCAVKFLDDKGRDARGGAIGLVCVDEPNRGKGYSTLVLEHAIAHAERIGLADLVLWTAKPGVYGRHGFRSEDNGVFGEVSSPPRALTHSSAATQSTWPDVNETRGLPPFASAGYRWRTATASAIVLHDARGPILAEWEGTEAAVADLLEHVMPSIWRINAFADDPLLATLVDRNCNTDLRPSNLQMIRSLRGDTSLAPNYGLRVLDRI